MACPYIIFVQAQRLLDTFNQPFRKELGNKPVQVNAEGSHPRVEMMVRTENSSNGISVTLQDGEDDELLVKATQILATAVGVDHDTDSDEDA
jgi:hypothetical protein